MIGAAPVAATFFDGHTAQRHPVSVSISGDGRGLRIDRQSPGGTALIWPLDRLRVLADQAQGFTLTLVADTEDETPRDPARLVLGDAAMIGWIRANTPHLKRRDVRRGTTGRLLRRALLAVVSIAAILFVILPRLADYIAMRMPLETEMRFGRAVISQMERFLGGKTPGALVCADPAGKAALDRLAQRLTEGQGLSYKLDISVFDNDMVNAFAAPGGQLVLIRGLLDKAETPDEVAGVLAHEIGHAEARDPTRLTLRAAGSAGIVSILLGDVTGASLIGVLGNQLLTASYTREAEANADAFAFRLLDATHVSSEGMADFFRRIAREGGGIPEILSSHPASDGRAEMAEANAKRQTGTTPALDDADWAALKAICKK